MISKYGNEDAGSCLYFSNPSVILCLSEDWSSQTATEDWSAAPTAQATEWVGTATEWS